MSKLTGVVALAAFAVVHLVVQASALGGGAAYDATVGSFAAQGVELALGVAAVFAGGVYLVRVLARAKDEAVIERYGSVRLWTAQRVSAAIILLFASVHLWEFPVQRFFFGLPTAAVYTRLTAQLSSTAAGIPWMALFYLLGIFAVAFHLSVALTAERPSARRLTTALGVALFALGSASVIAAATGTRLLSGADGDSAPPGAACGTDVPAKAPLFPAPSR